MKQTEVSCYGDRRSGLGVRALQNEVRSASRRYLNAVANSTDAAVRTGDGIRRARQILKSAGRAIRGRGLTPDEHIRQLLEALRKLMNETHRCGVPRDRSSSPEIDVQGHGAPRVHRTTQLQDHPHLHYGKKARMPSVLSSQEFWAHGQGKHLRRDLVIAALLPVEGSVATKRDELGRLQRLGALPPGPIVDKTTLWRWEERTRKQGDWPSEFEPARLLAELRDPDSADPYKLAQATLLMHARRLAGITSVAAVHDAISLEHVQDSVKLIRLVPTTLLNDTVLVCKLTQKIEEAFTATLRHSRAKRLSISAELLGALPPPVAGSSESSANVAGSTRQASTTDELYITSTEFGSAAAALIKPEPLAIIPADNASHQILQARARAMVVKPILNGDKTSREAAAFWQERVRAAFGTSGQDDIDGIPREVFRRWLLLSRETVSRWVARTRRAIARAESRGEIAPPLEQILRTDRKQSGKASRPKRTPKLIEAVHELYLTPAAPSATTVTRQLEAQKGIDVSSRTVQRICQAIPDSERALKRGGPAGKSVIIDKRYLRFAGKPNGLWTIDNSWIGKELIDPDVIIPADEDFQFESVIEELHEGNYTRRTRVERLYMTVVMDACTGLHLAVRLWDRPVNTRTTLLALFDAVLRYGIPDVLYSDNGSEFKNREITAVLNRAEIMQRFSRPYYPQARGRIERTFRTIKEQVLPFLPGYRGHDYALPEEELKVLIPLQRLEQELQRQVELLINQVPRRGMPVSRRQHYEDQIGAQQLRYPGGTPIELALPLLFQAKDVVVDEVGIRANGKIYTADELEMIPTGSKVRLYADPFRSTGYCAVLDIKGRERSAFALEAYGPNNPPPPIGLQKQRAADARRRMQQIAAEQRARAAELNELEQAKVDGEAMAADFVEAVEADWEILTTDCTVAPEAMAADACKATSSTNGSTAESTAVVTTQGPARVDRQRPARRRIRDDEVVYNPLL